jgi:hypothetical protein
MTREKIKRNMKQKITILFFIFGLFFPFSFSFAGTVLSSHKYAWSNNVGYINFENVIVGDSSLSGTAWSANKGLIKFNPAKGGVFNDGVGNLSGFAWGEQLGWIDFDNVSINSSTGQFSGTATGILVGTITFDCPNYCNVQTDWRQAVPPPVVPSRGGGGGFPIVNTTPVNLSNPIIPIPNNVPSNTGFVIAANPQRVAPTANNNTANNNVASPLFDVVSAPVQSTTGQGAIPPIILSIVAGVFISASALFFINKVIIYRKAKEKIKNENI